MPPRRPKSNGRPRRQTPALPAAESAPARARLFTNGRSQAVRLPKAFRFPGSEVLIRRGEGDTVVLEPVVSCTWPMGYWEAIDDLADDLALGRVPPIGARLLDLDSDDV
jgi:antitoxin VapB